MARPDTNEISAPTRSDTNPHSQSKSLTLQRISAILDEQAYGDITRAMNLFTEMIEKDAVLTSNFQTRTDAVSSREWKILPGGDNPKDIEAAEFALEVLKDIPDFQEDIKQGMGFVSHGFSVFEILWEAKGSEWWVEDIIWRNQNRFEWNKADPYELLYKITTGKSVPLTENKFIQFRYRGHQGYPATAGLGRLLTWYYILGNYSLKDWARALEKFGVPGMIGTYEESAQKEELKKNIAHMATDTFGVLAEGTTVQILERKLSGDWPFQAELEYMDNLKRTAILGHTGSNVSTSGKLGGEDAAENVRRDLIESDARVIEQGITWQLLKPLTEFNFGSEVAVPKFEIITTPPLDLTEEVKRDAVLITEMGVQTSARYMREKYNLPEPDDENDILAPPVSQGPQMFTAARDGGQFLFTDAARENQGNQDDKNINQYFNDVKKKGVRHLAPMPIR